MAAHTHAHPHAHSHSLALACSACMQCLIRVHTQSNALINTKKCNSLRFKNCSARNDHNVKSTIGKEITNVYFVFNWMGFYNVSVAVSGVLPSSVPLLPPLSAATPSFPVVISASWCKHLSVESFSSISSVRSVVPGSSDVIVSAVSDLG